MDKTQLNVYVPVLVKAMLDEICADRDQRASEVVSQMIQRSYRAMLVRKKADETQAEPEQVE